MAILLCLPGGALWSISPLGIALSEQRLLEGSDVFWKLFPTAPFALALGLAGLWWVGAIGSGWVGRVGAGVALFGILMVVAGNVGQFWLDLNDTFTVLAPAYYTFRGGLVGLAVGSVVFGVAGLLARSLPAWGAIPFIVATLCGLVAFVWDLGTLGSGLWAAFGAGWIWLGFSVVLSRLAEFLENKVIGRQKRRRRETGT